ncbi:hypothetical protein [Amaricoccus macauensis]|uniref:hypothetical protein n=1 Tax=Amaricoccus macauensis TaxID=57001 RepID=UPI003C7B211D
MSRTGGPSAPFNLNENLPRHSGWFRKRRGAGQSAGIADISRDVMAATLSGTEIRDGTACRNVGCKLHIRCCDARPMRETDRGHRQQQEADDGKPYPVMSEPRSHGL